MLNSETIRFLKCINTISNSIVLSYPITVGRTESADVAYMFDLSKLDTDGFDSELGIYNLSSFLNVFSLFNESRDVRIEDSVISVSDDRSSARYLISNPIILSQFSWNKDQFDKMEACPIVLDVDFGIDDIKRLKNAHSVFSELDMLEVECNENTKFSLTSSGEFKQSSNAFNFTKNTKSTKNFKGSISLETLFKIPVMNYRFVVRYNEPKNTYRVTLISDNLTMIISADFA